MLTEVVVLVALEEVTTEAGVVVVVSDILEEDVFMVVVFISLEVAGKSLVEVTI